MLKQANWAGYFPMLTNSAIPIFVADPGRAKTFSGMAIAEANGWRAICYELSRCVMEEASGYPRLVQHDGRDVMSYVPDERLDACLHEKCLVILDEFNQANDDVYAAFQTLIQKLNADNYVMGFMNPVECATNGRVLADPIVSRCWIGDWEFDHVAWLNGIRDKGRFAPPSIPKLSDKWEDHLGHASHRVLSYLTTHPEVIPCDASMQGEDQSRPVVRTSGDGTPFPTPRGWTAVVRCLAACADTRATKLTTYKCLKGLVGEEATAGFFDWDAQIGIQDAESLIDGEELKLPVSGDLQLLVLTNLACALEGNSTPERYERCMDILETSWEKASEYTMAAYGAVNAARPADYVPVLRTDGPINQIEQIIRNSHN